MTFEEILIDVAAYRGVPVADILGKSTANHIARARNEAIMWITDELEWPPYVTAVLFKRHRTTVFKAITAVSKRMRAATYANELIEMRLRAGPEFIRRSK